MDNFKKKNFNNNLTQDSINYYNKLTYIYVIYYYGKQSSRFNMFIRKLYNL